MESEVVKPATIGIIGAGQLARMMIEAASPLNINIRLLAASLEDSAALIAKNIDLGSPNNERDVRNFAKHCDVITFDHELVNLDIIRMLEIEGKVVHPSSHTLNYAQDKLYQRTLFSKDDLPVPVFNEITTLKDVSNFGESFGWPLVLKAQTDGYDGRGVWVINSFSEAKSFFSITNEKSIKMMAEQFIPIEKELSGLIARKANGEFILYPIVETIQSEGICVQVIAPADIDENIRVEAESLTKLVAEKVDVVGIMALELFLSNGKLLINEIATRPHNSGHFSIEGTSTSQFENHLRAVIDWPLGPAELIHPFAVMSNIIAKGEANPKDQIGFSLSTISSHTKLHMYDKNPRSGRKIGHVTSTGSNLDKTKIHADELASILMNKTID
ncbi:MAG: 5-(carboxyamino)imidazole ribonucleotide synthase [Chloroflexi bacterium]|mgnify:FL=1|nr:5-(carboxyamino)imidazole ribonucleotide synthase [Chloroflexota bacterium]|tara:strand:- start:17323 stop:18483 length:1161 start_codon:yes stop_codon:yes gene_type:complete